MSEESDEESFDTAASSDETVEKSRSDAPMRGHEAVVAPDSLEHGSDVSTTGIDDPAGIVAGDDTEASVDDRRSAASTIVTLALEGHIHTSTAVSTLATGLDDPASEAVALHALATIAEERPRAVDPVLDAVSRRLTDEPVLIRRHASRIVAERANSDPAAVTGLVSRLVEAVIAAGRSDAPDAGRPSHRLHPGRRTVADGRVGRRAAAVLGEVARIEPESVAPELDRLEPVIDPNSAQDPRLRERVTAIVRRVATASPAASIELLPSLVELLEAENVPVPARAGGAAALAALAETRLERTTDQARAAIPALESLLTDEDPSVRARAGSLLSYIAQRHPEATAPLTRPLIDRLDDEPVSVRASTVWTLGYIGTEPALDALRAVANTDPDPDLRALATDRLHAATDE